MIQNYIAECMELDVDCSLTESEMIELAEAGGLISWLKRAYTGMDTKLIDELRDEIKNKIKTEAQKEDALRDIDKFIREGRGLTGTQLVYHLFAPHTWLGPIVSFIIRHSNTEDGSRERYVDAMKKVRAEVAALKFKD